MGVLPTRGKIASMLSMMKEEANFYSLRGVETKTSHHLFLRCDVTTVVWRESPWPINIMVVEVINVAEWIKIIIHSEKSLGIPILENNLSKSLLQMLLI